MAESKEGLKNLLMRVKKESAKADLKQHSKNKNHSIWSHFFMANRRGKVEVVTDFIFWVPKSLWTVTVAMKLKDVSSLEEKL